jgi:hypothetical protein
MTMEACEFFLLSFFLILKQQRKWGGQCTVTLMSRDSFVFFQVHDKVLSSYSFVTSFLIFFSQGFFLVTKQTITHLLLETELKKHAALDC